MPRLRTALLACGLTALAAGTAFAATRDLHQARFDLPDGGVMYLTYAGDVAPTVRAVPFSHGDAPFTEAADEDAVAPLAQLELMAQAMERQSDALFQHMIAMRDDAPASGDDSTILVSGNVPAGVVQYQRVSTSDGSCTQSIEWRSDGSGSQPQMIRTSSGQCDGVTQTGKEPLVTAATAPALESAPAGHAI